MQPGFGGQGAELLVREEDVVAAADPGQAQPSSWVGAQVSASRQEFSIVVTARPTSGQFLARRGPWTVLLTRAYRFHVAFSPPEFIQANNVRNPHSQFSLGDEIVFHDQLFSGGQHVGDEGGSCVLVDVTQAPLANCSEVMRLPGGTITAQFLDAPPPVKQIAITGGTGVYDTAGGDGTLVEFGTFNGKLTLHVLSLFARGGGG